MNAIYVGTPSETGKIVSKQLVAILTSGADDRNIQLALEILSKAVKSPDYTTISNCNFSMVPKSE